MLAGQRIVIFGGRGDKNNALRDIHALDPVTMTWYQGPKSGGAPLARYNHSATLVGGTRMFVFGGWDGKKFFNDLHVLDLEAMAWQMTQTSGPEPSARQGHAAILIGNNLVIHGGFCLRADELKKAGLKQGTPTQQSYISDIRVLDTDTLVWSRLRISGSPPDARYGHSLSVSGSDIIMFGGWTKTSGNKNNHIIQRDESDYFMIWSTETMSWKRGHYVGNPPSLRYGHSATAIGPHLLIFGGWEYAKAINEIIVLREFAENPSKESPSEQSEGQDMQEVQEELYEEGEISFEQNQ